MSAFIDKETCTGCGACVDVCPVNVIEMKEDGKALVEEGCIECGMCVPECPVDAIAMQ